jgi:chromate transporter
MGQAHTVFRETWPVRGFGFAFDAPVLRSIDLWAFLLSAAAVVAMFRFKVGVFPTLAACSAAGVALYLVGLVS